MTNPSLETTSKPEYRRVGENLYRRQSSGVYYALVKRAGQQFRKSLKTDNYALAKRWLKDFRESVASLVSHDASEITFETVSDRWLESTSHTVKESTQIRRKTCLKALKPFFAGLTLRNVTRAHCDAWKTKRGDSIAPQTFAHELNTMRAVFDYAKEEGLILKNPADGIKRKRIYEQSSGNICANRATVSRWVKRRGVTIYGGNRKQRLFDRAEVLTALETDFPSEPKFISVEDAFLMASRPYPNQRRKSQ